MQTIKSLKHKKPLIVILGLVLSLIFIELLLRAIGFTYLLNQDFKNFYSLDKKTDYVILALGESTTQTGGRHSWPSQLENILNKKDIGTTFKVINKGRSGTTSHSILADIEKRIDTFQPDMVITMMGINDGHVPGLPEIEPEFAVNVEHNNKNNVISFLDNFKVFKLSKLIFVTLQRKFQSMTLLSGTIYADTTHNYLLKGQEYIEQKNYRDAISTFERAITLDPNDERAYLELYNLYNSLNEPNKVIEVAQRFLLRSPQSTWAYVALAHGLANSGKVDQAEEAFRQALRVNPDDANSYIEYGNFLRDQKRFEEFSQLMERAVQSNSENPQVHNKLAESYRYLGNYQAALKAISLNPNSNAAKFELANIYRQMGDSERASQVLGVNTELEKNYREIKNIVVGKGLKFVAVQYPVVSVEPLKNMLGTDNVIYVDNEKVFKDALRDGVYEEYFIDRFAGEFGHATEKGNELLASNIAASILEKVFKEPYREMVQ